MANMKALVDHAKQYAGVSVEILERMRIEDGETRKVSSVEVFCSVEDGRAVAISFSSADNALAAFVLAQHLAGRNVSDDKPAVVQQTVADDDEDEEPDEPEDESEDEDEPSETTPPVTETTVSRVSAPVRRRRTRATAAKTAQPAAPPAPARPPVQNGAQSQFANRAAAIDRSAKGKKPIAPMQGTLV